MDERTVRVAAQEGGERIDKYLAAYGEPFVSRNFVQSLIADGRVRVNGSVVNRPSFRLSAGDVIEVVLPLPPSPVPEPEAIPLDIVYEDGSVIVVNKPRGMVVHPAPGNTEGTLVNALLAHCELRGVGSKERPGIVHRLDKGTSGLMVVAKEPMAYMDLVRQLQARTVVRRYVAFVHGKVPDERWTVNAPIGRDPLNRQRMAVLPDGKPAVTHFTCLERFGDFSSVRAELVTGRTTNPGTWRTSAILSSATGDGARTRLAGRGIASMPTGPIRPPPYGRAPVVRGGLARVRRLQTPVTFCRSPPSRV